MPVRALLQVFLVILTSKKVYFFRGLKTTNARKGITTFGRASDRGGRQRDAEASKNNKCPQGHYYSQNQGGSDPQTNLRLKTTNARKGITTLSAKLTLEIPASATTV